MKKNVLIRTEASAKADVGTGHLWRSLWIGRSLKAKGARVSFAVSGEKGWDATIRKQGFTCRSLNGNGKSLVSWKGMLSGVRPDAVVFDRWENSPTEVCVAKEKGARIVLLDEVGECIRLGDLSINCLKASPLAHYRGEKYVVTPPRKRVARRFPSKARTLVCSFGGYDTHSLMRRVLEVLAKDNPFDRIWCFCDPSLRDTPRIQKLQTTLGKKVKLFFGDPRLSDYLAKADMGLISGGLTLFEALACGLPSLVISQYSHQAKRAASLVSRGLVIDLGLGKYISWKWLMPRLRSLQDDIILRRKLSRAGRRFCDGNGLERVTNLVWDLLEK